jgi:hypothetical protein
MDVMMLCHSDSDGQHNIALEQEITSIARSPDQDIVMHEPSVSHLGLEKSATIAS